MLRQGEARIDVDGAPEMPFGFGPVPLTPEEDVRDRILRFGVTIVRMQCRFSGRSRARKGLRRATARKCQRNKSLRQGGVCLGKRRIAVRRLLKERDAAVQVCKIALLLREPAIDVRLQCVVVPLPGWFDSCRGTRKQLLQDGAADAGGGIFLNLEQI